MITKRGVYSQSRKGTCYPVAPSLAVPDFYREGWILGIVYDNPGITPAEQVCPVEAFVEKMRKVFSATRSATGAFKESYPVLTEEGRKVVNFAFFILEKDGIWTASNGKAEVFKIGDRRSECLTKFKRLSPPDEETPSVIPKLDWASVDDDDRVIVLASAALLAILKEEQVVKLARNVVPKFAAYDTVSWAHRKNSSLSYTEILVSL